MASRVESRIRYNYTRIENPIFDEYMAKIGPYAFGVYGLLARIAGNKDTCFPGVPYLVEVTGFSKNTILKALETLKDFGLIEIEKRQNDQGGDLTNLYVLLPIPDTEEGAGDEPPGVRQMHPRRSLGDSDRVQEMNPKYTDSSKQTESRKQQQASPALTAALNTLLPDSNVVVASTATPLFNALYEAGVSHITIGQLIKDYGEEACRQQLEWLPYRKCDHPPATLVRSIREDWAKPRIPTSPARTRPTAQSARKTPQDALGSTVGTPESIAGVQAVKERLRGKGRNAE